jgi:hypothetical protein
MPLKGEQMTQTILAPVIALSLWTFVMWAWLYATRIPAMAKLKLNPDPRRPASEFRDAMPHQARWVADNYNHLLEQPTLFYAVALVIAFAGDGGIVDLALAWAYVILRIVHSLIQATVNVIPVRFMVFSLASLCLLALAIRAAIQVF